MLIVNTQQYGPLGIKFVFEEVLERKEFKKVTHAVIVLNPYEPQDSQAGQECIWGSAFLHPSDKFFKEDGRVKSLERAIEILTMSNKRDNRTRREILGGYYLRDVSEDFKVKLPSYTKYHNLNPDKTQNMMSPVVNANGTADPVPGPTSVEEETGF